MSDETELPAGLPQMSSKGNYTCEDSYMMFSDIISYLTSFTNWTPSEMCVHYGMSRMPRF